MEIRSVDVVSSLNPHFLKKTAEFFNTDTEDQGWLGWDSSAQPEGHLCIPGISSSMFWRPHIRDTVFVAMAFRDADLQPVWEKAIQPATDEDCRPLRAIRVDVSTLSGSVITDILDNVAHSRPGAGRHLSGWIGKVGGTAQRQCDVRTGPRPSRSKEHGGSSYPERRRGDQLRRGRDTSSSLSTQ